MMVKTEDKSQLDWIDIHNELNDNDPESMGSRFIRKFLQNPLIPIGMGVTCTALGMGLYYLKEKNSPKQQLMMRLRIAAQGFTVFALLGGMFYQISKQQQSKS